MPTISARSLWVRFKSALDRPGGRALLGAILSTVITLRHRSLCRCRWSEGCWTYRRADGITFRRAPDVAGIRQVETARWDYWAYRPQEGDVTMVVGAGLGREVSTLARLVGPTGRVYAFEAHPRTYGRLVRLSQLNRWTNVELINVAITDRTETVVISEDEDYASNDIWRGGGPEVAATSLDEFARERALERVDFLTMNIEGAERLAVNGMTMLARKISHAAISCHDFLGVEEKKTKAHVRDRLVSMGFCVRDRSDHTNPEIRNVLYASRPGAT